MLLQLVELGDLEILINCVQPCIEAKIGVKLFGGLKSGGLTSTIEVRVRLEEDTGL